MKQSPNPFDENLFRQEALCALDERHYGRPVAHMPPLWFLLGALLATCLTLAIIFLFSASYARKETAIGWLVPNQGLVRLNAGEYGTLLNVTASAGDTVQAGDPLATLSFDRDIEPGKSAAQTVSNEIDREISEKLSQRRLSEAALQARLRQIELELSQVDREFALVAHQIEQQQENVRLAAVIKERFERLEGSPANSPLQTDQSAKAHNSEQQNLTALNVQKERLAGRRLALDGELAQLPLEAAQRASILSSELASLRARKAELARRSNAVVSAPIDGRVASVRTTPGGVAPNTLLVSLLPASATLHAELFVPSEGIGFVQTGQSVRLMYSAFPHQRFGSARGTVSDVSSVILQPEDLPSALSLSQPAYRVDVILAEQNLSAMGQVYDLLPGMALQAEIIQERRSFFQWLFDPLFQRKQ